MSFVLYLFSQLIFFALLQSNAFIHELHAENKTQSIRQLSHNLQIDSTRDGSLRFLTHLLNNSSSIFQSWTIKSHESIESYRKLILAMTPWVIAEKSVPISISNRPLPIQLNCKNIKYNRILTGEEGNSSRLIIDFVPFG
jgi:hypothetical protein